MEAQSQFNELLFNFVNGNIWAIIPEKLEAFIFSFSAKIDRSNPGKVEETFPSELGLFTGYGYKTIGNVAVFSVEGIIQKNFSIEGHLWEGMVSTLMLQKGIQDALENPEINSIVLNIDSPGGTVGGTKELADYIYDAKSQKPFYSFANGLMASAAYYIGSAANEIYAFDTSYIGSIGVYRPHVNAQKFYESMGLEITLIHAGKEKVVGNPYSKLSDEDKKIIQTEVNDQYTLFVDSVARNRGVSSDEVLTNMADGKIFIAQKAAESGLIDGIGTLEEVIAYAQKENSVINAIKTI